MASDAAVAYEQEMQDVVTNAVLDAASMMSDMVPAFPPPLVHQPPPNIYASLLPADPSYLVKAEHTEDLSSSVPLLPDHPSLGYMNVQIESTPMEAVLDTSVPLDTLGVPSYEASLASAADTASSFGIAPQATDAPMSLELSPALSTPSPPLPISAATQPLTANTLQASSPPFAVLTSSIGGALIQQPPMTSPPRTATSVSPVPLAAHTPPSIPSPYASSASQSPTSSIVAASQPLLPPAEAEHIVIKDEVPIAKQKKEVANFLNALAKDFMAASQAVHYLEGSPEELPDELKSRIANLSRMAAQLSISGTVDSSPPPAGLPVAPPTPPASVSLNADHHGGYPLFPPVSVGAFDPTQQLASDPSSRKRGPCVLDEHRSVKAMKREPLDHPLPVAPEPLPLDASAAFPATAAIPSSAISPIAQSRPPSPPLVPTTFAAAVAQYHMVPPALPPVPPMPQAPMSVPPLAHSNVISPLAPGLPLAAPSVYSNGRAAWGDGTGTPSRHHHSLSAGAILNPIQGMPMPPVSVGSTIVSGPSTPITSQPPPLVRTVRSGSVSSLSFESNNYFNFPEKSVEVPISGTRSARHSVVNNNWYFGDGSSPTNTSEEPSTTRNSPSDDDDDDSSSESDDEVNIASKSTTHLPSTEGTSSSGSDIPAEYRAEVDRVFFEYLNSICSNLEAKDSKGDHIHQTLMAKKMQRLDESPDFRPFKFRIQAFTTAFLEELARQGYTEDKIPMKKIRNYLWHQPHILRFNEDGKKAKSKGNHIWNVEARKLGDGRWEFRPFHRKLAGTPPGIAYAGLRWSWTPRIWDPQASFTNVPVQYSSPSLPPWLSWKDDVLSGIPPPDAESCKVTVIAQYVYDGVEGQLVREIPVVIAPVGTADTGQYPRSRRPSGASEAPRRSASDSALSQAPVRAKNARNVAPVPVPIPNESSSTRVIRVLQNVAQRVNEEAESQSLPSMSMGPGQEIAKQKHVLDQTVEAMDMEMSGHGGMQSKRLAIAAQQVVIQAAANVLADRNVSIGRAPIVPNKSTALQRVSVGELSDATHDAIVAAVKTNGPASTDVDIIVTAASILKAKAPGPESNSPPVVPPRTIPSLNFASNLSTLPEFT